jgi:hypothetical protein
MWVVKVKAQWSGLVSPRETDRYSKLTVQKPIESISDLQELYEAAALAMGFHPDTVNGMFGEDE